MRAMGKRHQEELHLYASTNAVAVGVARRGGAHGNLAADLGAAVTGGLRIAGCREIMSDNDAAMGVSEN
jgi:hypothetical protein